VALAVLSLAIMGASVSAAFAASPGWSVTRLASGNVDYPVVFGGGKQVAWIAYDGNGHRQVVTQAIGSSTVTTLTSAGYSCGSLVASGNRIVWFQEEDTSYHNRVYTWTIGEATPFQVTPTAVVRSDLRISGDRLAWLDCSSTYQQVYTYKFGVTSSPAWVTASNYYRGDLYLNGDVMVWDQSIGGIQQIVRADYRTTPGSVAQITFDTTTNHWRPIASGDLLIWMEAHYSTSGALMCKNGSAPAALISPDTWASFWAIEGDRVVFSDGQAVAQMFTWTPSGGRSLISANSAGVPVISGGRAFWFSGSYLGPDLYSWKVGGSPATLVSSFATQVAGPGVDGERVVWSERGGSAGALIKTAVTTPTHLSKLALSPKRPKRGKKVTFSAAITSGAGAGGKVKLALARWERKKGSKKYYWHVLKTLTLKGSGGKVKASAKLTKRGKWKMTASFAGWYGYLPAQDVSKSFRVR
jgi:hypothetical protein